MDLHTAYAKLRKKPLKARWPGMRRDLKALPNKQARCTARSSCRHSVSINLATCYHCSLNVMDMDGTDIRSSSLRIRESARFNLWEYGMGCSIRTLVTTATNCQATTPWKCCSSHMVTFDSSASSFLASTRSCLICRNSK
jgi:hypothetical protein